MTTTSGNTSITTSSSTSTSSTSSTSSSRSPRAPLGQQHSSSRAVVRAVAVKAEVRGDGGGEGGGGDGGDGGRHDIVLRNSTTRPNSLPATYKSIMHPRCAALSRACSSPSTAPRPSIGIREPNLFCPWARFRGGDWWMGGWSGRPALILKWGERGSVPASRASATIFKVGRANAIKSVKKKTTGSSR